MIQFGNFIFKFSIGEGPAGEDFIAPDNLKSFRLHEEVGNLRPIIVMSFELTKKSIIPYLNSGNILKISFGLDKPDKDVMLFQLCGDDTNRDYTLGYIMEIRAALYIPKFTNKIGCKNYGNKTSLQVMQAIASSNNFELKTNLTKTNDKQEWCRIGETEWNYMKKLWLHSYLNKDTFMAFGFDAKNIYFYDMKLLSSQPAKWTFSSMEIGNKGSSIVNIGWYTTKNDYGMLEDLIGRNLITKTYNIDTGTFKSETYALTNFSSINSNKLSINNTNASDYSYAVISNDVHENYIKAYNQNIRNNLMYSTYSIYCPTGGQFKKLKLLDTVKFQVYPQDNRLDGIAYITSIVYQYEQGRFNMNITLNKPCPSGLRGEQLQTEASN